MTRRYSLKAAGLQDSRDNMYNNAITLLTPGRMILVEAGEVRHRARLVRSLVDGSVTAELLASPQVLPETGTPVTLVVPVLHRTWRFPSHVLARPEAGARIATFASPAHAEQLAGRRAARVDVALPLRCRRPGDDEWIATYAFDLSVSGLRIAFPAVLERGAVLEIEMSLEGRLHHTEGAVAWQRVLVEQPGDTMYSVGIRLASVSDGLRDRLTRYLQSARHRTRNDEIRVA